MKDTAPDTGKLLYIQILILALGESRQFGWWKCSFLTPTGLSYLKRLYPHNYFWSAVHSSTEAARSVHDSSIGIGDVAHLFRLPREIDNILRENAPEVTTPFISSMTPLLSDKAKLLDALRTLVIDPPTKVQAGPVRIGAIHELHEPGAIGKIAAVYWSAFQSNAKAFPYFADTKKKNL